MQFPKIIIFDLGKVLLDFDYVIAARKIGAGGKLPVEQIRHYLGASDLLIRFETGAISPREFFEEIRGAIGLTISFEEFKAIFTDIFSEIPEMIELQAALRRKGFPTYIFSNTNELQLPFIRGRFPFFANFDGYVLSYEVGAMKPDTKIYETLEALTGKHGGDLLYIDDRLENVEAGARRGWQTILQETPERTISAIRELGLVF